MDIIEIRKYNCTFCDQIYTEIGKTHDKTCGNTFTKNRYVMYIISEADDRDGRCRSVQDKENYMHHL